MAVLKVNEVAEKLREFRGNRAAVGRHFGVSRVAVWKFCQKHASLMEVLDDCRESMKDHAESMLHSQVLAGNERQVRYYLSNQAKDRGYVPRSEHRHGGDESAPPIRTEDVSGPVEVRAILGALRALAATPPDSDGGPGASAGTDPPGLDAPLADGGGPAAGGGDSLA